MSKKRKKEIGLQNRLEIIIQAILDFDEEGGEVQFSIDLVQNSLIIHIPHIHASDDQIQLLPVSSSSTIVPPASDI